MKWIGWTFCLLSTLSTTLQADPQIQREIEIGTPGFSYLDPEFEPNTFQAAFYTTGNDVYLGQIDPATGKFVSPNHQYIDHAASFLTTFNGPEWGNSVNGPALYYTKVDAQGNWHNFRYRGGAITQLDKGDFNLVANYPSKNSSDPASLVMGMFLSGANLVKGGLSSYGFSWGIFSEASPSRIQNFSLARIGKGPRFVPGAPQVVTNTQDRNGVVQLAIYDFPSNRTTIVTTDPDTKDSGVAFPAPELNDELLLFANVNSGSTYRVYRKINGAWQTYKEFMADPGCNLQNPQVIRYKGKTYFVANQTASGSSNGDILLFSMDGSLRTIVSDPTVTLKREDPEYLVSGDHLYIYYYEIGAGRLFLSDVVIP